MRVKNIRLKDQHIIKGTKRIYFDVDGISEDLGEEEAKALCGLAFFEPVEEVAKQKKEPKEEKKEPKQSTKKNKKDK